MFQINLNGERLNMFLAIKTADKVTELFLCDGSIVVRQEQFEAGRELSKVLLREIKKILQDDFDSLKGLIVFVGPGSFTGLRIGISTMNALAYGQTLPIVGADGDGWMNDGVRRLSNDENDKVVMPRYGGEANITLPKK